MINEKFRKSAISAAVCQALLMSGGLVYAQEGSEDGSAVLEEVVVTGIRAALRQGINAKRDNAQFVDSIIADDIGKLADVNVAETLGRISGVQVDRGIGEGSDISIRGQRQNVILLNGRQIFDASGRGGIGPDRLNTSTFGLLTLVPSGLIGGLDVTKLGGADSVSGSIGGIVDIKTRKPLDKSGFNGAASVGFGDGDLSDGTDTEYFALLSNTFADDTLGIQLGVSSKDRNVAERGLNTFSGYGSFEDNGVTFTDPGVNGDPNGDGTFGFFHLDPRLQTIEEDRENEALSGLVQWKPNDNVEVIFDTFYSSTESDRDRYWQGFFAGFGTASNLVFSEDEILLSGNIGRPIQTNVEFAGIEAEILSTAVQLNWSVNENVQWNTQLSSSESESSFEQLFFRLQSASAADISFDITAGDFGSFTSNVDLADPTALNLAILFDSDFINETDTTELTSDVNWNFGGNGFFSSVDLGIRLQEVETDSTELSRDIRPNLNVATTASVSAATEVITTDFFTGLSARENVFTGCEVFLADFNASDQQLCTESTNTASQLNTFSVNEDISSVYAKVNYESEIGGSKISGNIGFRVVDRDLESIGNVVTDDVVTPSVFNRSDTEVLPSAVIKVDVNDDLVLRFGGSRVIAFPNSADLNNGLRLNGDNTGSGGSPDLDPFLANQFDLSAEYYFAGDSILALGLFYKDIETFIVSRTDQEIIQGETFSIARQVNGESAEVTGLELSYQQPFGDTGFGIQANYSYIDSNTPIEDDAGRSLPLSGLSENSLNLVGYYETETLSIRLAYNVRDDYLTGLGPNNTGVFIDGFEDLSATIGWNITDNYSLQFEALNLLDSQLETFNAVPEALRTNVEYGQLFKLTFAAQF